MVIAVQKWGMQILEGDEMVSDNYQSKLWRQGLLVTYDGGFFLVESFHDDVRMFFFCFQPIF